MVDERLQVLVDSYQDEAINENDAKELAGIISSGGEDCDVVMGELEFCGLISMALDDIDGDVFLRSFNERCYAEETKNDFKQVFETRRMNIAEEDEQSDSKLKKFFKRFF